MRGPEGAAPIPAACLAALSGASPRASIGAAAAAVQLAWAAAGDPPGADDAQATLDAALAWGAGAPGAWEGARHDPPSLAACLRAEVALDEVAARRRPGRGGPDRALADELRALAAAGEVVAAVDLAVAQGATLAWALRALVEVAWFGPDAPGVARVAAVLASAADALYALGETEPGAAEARAAAAARGWLGGARRPLPQP